MIRALKQKAAFIPEAALCNILAEANFDFSKAVNLALLENDKLKQSPENCINVQILFELGPHLSTEVIHQILASNQGNVALSKDKVLRREQTAIRKQFSSQQFLIDVHINQTVSNCGVVDSIKNSDNLGIQKRLKDLDFLETVYWIFKIVKKIMAELVVRGKWNFDSVLHTQSYFPLHWHAILRTLTHLSQNSSKLLNAFTRKKSFQKQDEKMFWRLFKNIKKFLSKLMIDCLVFFHFSTVESVNAVTSFGSFPHPSPRAK
jgi:hypothetical protein